MEPMTIKSSPQKYAVLLIVSLALLALAAFLPLGGPGDPTYAWRWPVGICFGFTALVFTALLIRPQRLSLDRHGLTMSGGLILKAWDIAWSDIDHFVPMPRGMIGFTYRPGARPDSSLRRFNRRMSNVDGGLPGRWERSTPEMVALLEDYRSRALRHPGPA